MMYHRRELFSIVALLCAVQGAHGAVRYVDGALTTGLNNGTSWVDAYYGPAAVATAMNAAVSGDQVWVKAGTYKPTTTTTRTMWHTMKSGVGVYGGFAGGETLLTARNPLVNVTTLTGDLTGNDTPGSATYMGENSYHVVMGSSVLNTAILDGFRIVGGYANVGSASNYDKGGGIIILTNGNPTIRNCKFIGNRCTFGGGAGYIYQAQATFTDCEFTDNVGGSYGGAFDTNSTTVKWERCIFTNNQAARAGAIESFGSSQTTITNCIFRLNKATTTNSGGAIWMGTTSTVTVRDSTFVGNTTTATSGGGFYNTSGTGSIANCIFWGNTGAAGAMANNQITAAGGTNTVSYSLVQLGASGAGNLSADPQFVDLAAGDLRLQMSSPAIDAGSNALIPAGVTLDFALLARRVDIASVADTGVGTAPIVDMGASEVQAPPPPACPPDTNDDGYVDGLDLSTVLSGWATPMGDVNGDGYTDGGDLAVILSGWGACP
ncbi:MAG: hypothetical protein EXS15_01615 [Phycisphaerales bacterium]|nr:hypothetical protein [Phycisphaerales bacterium]